MAKKQPPTGAGEEARSPDAAANSPQVLALALIAMDGVGQVTVRRLLRHFASYDTLRRCPREQLRNRLRGTPHVDALVGTLLDDAAMRPRLDRSWAALDALQARGVYLITVADDTWPGGLDALDSSVCPAFLHAYGAAEVLTRPCVAFFARPPVPEHAFEQAQLLETYLLERGAVPIAGAQHGFDVVVQKRAGHHAQPMPSIHVASAGLAKLPKPVRHAVAAAIHAGGLLVSPFDMNHGPFDHDDRQRCLVQAALADACIFVAPQPATPEWNAMEWALEAQRPVFSLAEDRVALPEAVHPLHADVDFEWVFAAIEGAKG